MVSIGKGKKMQNYGTPRALVSALADRHVGGWFDLDLAASSLNRVAPLHLGPGSAICEDATVDPVEVVAAVKRALPDAPWRIFCNPPFNNIRPFAELCAQLAHEGATVVLLVPSRPGTEWQHRLEHPDDGIVVHEDRILANWHPSKRSKSPRIAFIDPETGELDTAPFEHVTAWILRPRLYAGNFR